jgi:SRSO17 transposase
MLAPLARRFQQFSESFRPHFHTQTRAVFPTAQAYLQGLVQAGKRKRNMERMAEVVPDTDEQQFQHFLSNSPWEEAPVIAEVACRVDLLLGGQPDSGLLLDETSATKKGKHSVGVARQWNGRLGKVDNCQVSVWAALVRGARVSPVGVRLYLPAEWTDDPPRCEAAGVPLAQQVFRSKSQLALELVQEARQRGLRFAWVGVDGGYGKEPAFLRELDARGEVFVAEVHKDQRVYLEDPRPQVPETASLPGRRKPRLQAQSAAVRVDRWADAQPAEAWQPLPLRDSTKGVIKVEVLHARVWVWDGQEAQARCWHLVVRRDRATRREYKYALSNAPADTSWQVLAQRQGQRYWVERIFEDAKGEVGLTDYQVRGWRGWHHHAALVMMAMLFLLQEREAARSEQPLLSCADVVRLLGYVLPRRDVTEAEILAQLKQRHVQRQASIDSAYRRQRLRQQISSSDHLIVPAKM